jgi:hypothetical protein
MEDIAHQAITLAQVKIPTLTRHDTGCILPPVLQDR